MPLQLSEFTDMPLLFIIFEPCHYNFKTHRNMSLHTSSMCFSNFMDQNTPNLLLPLIPSLFPWQIPSVAAAPVPIGHATCRGGGGGAQAAGGSTRQGAARLHACCPIGGLPWRFRRRRGRPALRGSFLHDNQAWAEDHRQQHESGMLARGRR